MQMLYSHLTRAHFTQQGVLNNTALLLECVQLASVDYDMKQKEEEAGEVQEGRSIKQETGDCFNDNASRKQECARKFLDTNDLKKEVLSFAENVTNVYGMCVRVCMYVCACMCVCE